jgi:hypothetical protein
MRSRKQNHFGRHLLVLTFLFILFAGSFGLATVWLRQQIAESAVATRAMERRLAEIERLDLKLTSDLAMATKPFNLELLNQRHALGLRPPLDSQLVQVAGETQVRFAQFRWNQLVSLPPETYFSFYALERN